MKNFLNKKIKVKESHCWAGRTGLIIKDSIEFDECGPYGPLGQRIFKIKNSDQSENLSKYDKIFDIFPADVEILD